jgi:thioredoxin reductase
VVDVALGLIERGELRFAGDGVRLSTGGAATPADEREQSVLLVDGDDEAVEAAASIERAVEHVRVVHARDIRSATELCRSSR